MIHSRADLCLQGEMGQPSEHAADVAQACQGWRMLLARHPGLPGLQARSKARVPSPSTKVECGAIDMQAQSKPPLYPSIAFSGIHESLRAIMPSYEGFQSSGPYLCPV